MRRSATLSVLLASVAVFGVAGCKKKSPTGPDILPPAATTSTVPQIQSLSISVVAPYVGQTINSVLEQALTQGLTATGASRWTRNCPAGGTAQIDLPANYQVQAGNVVMLTDTDLILTDCDIETKGATFLETPTLLGRILNLIIRPVSAQSRARIRARGRPKTRGKWRAPINTSRGPEYREGEGARVTGSIEVSQLNCGSGPCPSQIGPISMDCNLDGKVCNGNIGGVGVTQGPPDTAPPPNPTPTTTTTTTTVPPNSINVTGTWTESFSGGLNSGNRPVVLSQIGSNVTGETSGLPPEFSGSFTGTVTGSTVRLTEVYTARISVPGQGTVNCRFTMVHTLTATSNTRMSGPFSGSLQCSVPGIPPINIPDSGTSTWTR